jgi:hypothetical protein
MFTRKIATSLAVPALLLASSVAQAGGNAAADQCVFEKYAASQVAPYRAEENYGYGSFTKLRGAQIFVPAREGLTREWLQLSVQNALASSANAPASCQTNVPAVQVSVVSAGAGFWVQLGAADEHQAEALLKWAKNFIATHHPVATVASVK